MRALELVGKGAIILGGLSFARLAGEAVQLVAWGRLGDSLFLCIMGLDAVLAGLWIASGWAIRERRAEALAFTVAVAAASLSDAVVSAVLMGPDMLGIVLRRFHDPDLRVGIFGSRLLLYAVVLVAGPCSLAVALRDYRDRGAPELYEKVSRVGLVGIAAFSGVVSLGFALALKLTLMAR